ncbi:hypothetical protein BPOR_0404g00100 [Botrytis porri]|uniref:Uncharacterized protein n=1 Tax=Botrytis porri TaxID=87229 RepID=A0A4Z1KM40_9HELO|nr:hypothetical protein BPOR_0404g00100 [Botrytis porri]
MHAATLRPPLPLLAHIPTNSDIVGIFSENIPAQKGTRKEKRVCDARMSGSPGMLSPLILESEDKVEVKQPGFLDSPCTIGQQLESQGWAPAHGFRTFQIIGNP